MNDPEFSALWAQFERHQRFGDLVRMLREARSLTQSELAEKCDVSTPLISLVERGKRRCQETLAEAFIRHLGVPEELEGEFRLAAASPEWLELKSSNAVLSALLESLHAEQFDARERERLLDAVQAAHDAWLSAMRKPVSAAVIPVAGWQAALLSRAQTERLVDVAISEAAACGIERFIVITAASQKQLASTLRKRSRHDFSIKTVQQEKTDAGIGDALRAARFELEGQHAFALMFPDDRVDPVCLKDLISAYQQHQCSAVVVQGLRKEDEELELGGVVTEFQREKHAKDSELLWIGNLEEKIELGERKVYSIVGRYILTSDIFSAIERTQVNKRTGKIELTDALNHFAKDQRLIGLVCSPKHVKSISAARRRFKQEIEKIFGK